MGRNSATAAVALLLNLTLGVIEGPEASHKHHSRSTLSGCTMQYHAAVAGQYICGLWHQEFA